MMEWFTQFLDKLLQFIPRIAIVRATHGGVKWIRGHKVKPMKPGIHWYWPLTTEFEVLVTARQTLNIKSQVLTTADDQSVAVSAVAVYRICNVCKAFGKRNWNPYELVQDITQTAIVGVVSNATMADLKDVLAINERLTAACLDALKPFGIQVYSVGLTDLAKCRVFRLIGEGNTPV